MTMSTADALAVIDDLPPAFLRGRYPRTTAPAQRQKSGVV